MRKTTLAAAGILLITALTSACGNRDATTQPTDSMSTPAASPSQDGALGALVGTFEFQCGDGGHSIVIDPDGTATFTWGGIEYDDGVYVGPFTREVRFTLVPDGPDAAIGTVEWSDSDGFPVGTPVRVVWNTERPGVILTLSEGSEFKLYDPGSSC